MGRMSDYQIDQMETPIMDRCADCDGDGYIDREVPRPHGPDRDVGVIDVWTEVCETCSGDGKVERLCECGSCVTLGMGHDAEVCMECADD